jgi:hypothetical protein
MSVDFPGTIGAEQAIDFTRSYAQIDPAQHRDMTVAFGKSVN